MSTSPSLYDDDHFHDECGVFGVFGHEDAAAHTALGLHALQHRGQEAAGIVTCDGTHFHNHRSLGLVGDNFSSQTVIERLQGPMAIGHNRYSTAGETVLRNVQPLFADFDFGGLAIGHNGNLTNAYSLRKKLVQRGCIFQSTMDTEIIVHLIAISEYSTVVDRMIDALRQVEGAYSLVALTNEGLIGVRDPIGVRPLVLGRIDGAYILASETCALDIIGAEFVRNVDPGEIIVIDGDGAHHVSYSKLDRPNDSGHGDQEYEAENLRADKDDFGLKDPTILGGQDEFDDGITLQILTVFPGLVLQQVRNSLVLRQIMPRGVDRTDLIWTNYGFEDDDPELTDLRLLQANFIGPAGFISMEDGAVGEFVQRALPGTNGETSVVKMGGDAVASSASRVTEASIRGFWKTYRGIMDI